MKTQHKVKALFAIVACAAAGTSPAHTLPGQVEIRGHYDNAVGTSDAASQGVIGASLLKSRPALRPGELLEFVPGVIVTQHSGDGKANQYFLRGFNLDHGTDFATSVNGLPVNMPTHAHGQGYSDLNFLIPEIVQRIDYRKGPYFAGDGDFSSAGAADFVYRRRLDAPLAQFTLGGNGYRRGVFAGSTGDERGAWLAALELAGNDGPWTVPQQARKNNGVLSYSQGTPAQGFSASLMSYHARWRSTDQVPQRLIDAGEFQGRPFGRFDSLDDSNGGRSARTSLSALWHRNDAGGQTRISGYTMRYRLQLWSNFTYVLERPDDGDQFEQQDGRSVYGVRASHAFDHLIGDWVARTEIGAQLRHDRIRVGLFDTVQRQRRATTREDNVRETLAGVHAETSIELQPKLRVSLGLRADHVLNRVASLTLADNSGRASDTQFSPKLSLVAGPFEKTELFFNAGRGFHSNDARGTTARIDPKRGDAVDRVPPLVASRGFELGARTELITGLQSSLSLWKLDFDSELEYIGDAGATEASAGSRRRGVEFNNRWTPVPWFLLDADFAWNRARFKSGERIPNSVDKVASVAASLRDLGPWSASLQWRYLGPGALIEDNSVRSFSSLTTNLRVSRQLGEKAELTLDVFNLTDRKVNDIQYFYESQVPGESAAVEDRHVHPAEPRTVRLSLRVNF